MTCVVTLAITFMVTLAVTFMVSFAMEFGVTLAMTFVKGAMTFVVILAMTCIVTLAITFSVKPSVTFMMSLANDTCGDTCNGLCAFQRFLALDLFTIVVKSFRDYLLIF